MSKDKAEQPKASSSITPPGTAGTAGAKQADKAGADKRWTPKKREVKPAKLTAEQYLKTANMKEGIGGLILSMYGEKIMSFTEWEILVKSLLKRPVK